VIETSLQTLRVEAVRVLALKRLGIRLAPLEVTEVLNSGGSVSGALVLLARRGLAKPPFVHRSVGRTERPAQGALWGPIDSQTPKESFAVGRRGNWFTALLARIVGFFRRTD